MIAVGFEPTPSCMGPRCTNHYPAGAIAEGCFKFKGVYPLDWPNFPGVANFVEIDAYQTQARQSDIKRY